MNLIRLTVYPDRPVYINPENVSLIGMIPKNNGTMITFMHGTCEAIDVLEPHEAVAALIAGHCTQEKFNQPVVDLEKVCSDYDTEITLP